jgi:hypothetical protein
VRHDGPSALDLDTLSQSKGRIPEAFLRGCGLSDWEIFAARLYAPELEREEVDGILYDISAVRSGEAIQISPLFISYSHADAEFVDHVELELNARRVRFWRDSHELKAGRLEKQLERAISMNPIVLLVLSRHSVVSDWVEWEAAKARDLEQQRGRDVLCPVALDEAWKACDWPGPLRRQITKYNILDFSRWQETETFKRQFGRLMDGLGLFYRDGGRAGG